jgi:hypothetical protein
MNSSELIISSSSNSTINWGLYNFTIQISDSSLKSELALKLFVFKNLTIKLNEVQIIKMNDLIEKWWSMNSNNFKRKWNNNIGDNNGDDLDTISQEYYKFSSSSSTNNNLNITNLFQMATKYLISNPSNSIIILISLFLLIAFVLILFITYKHCNHESNNKIKGNKKRESTNKKFINLASQNSSELTPPSPTSINQYDEINIANNKECLDNHHHNLAAKKIAAAMSSVVNNNHVSFQ